MDNNAETSSALLSSVIPDLILDLLLLPEMQIKSSMTVLYYPIDLGAN